MTTSLQPDFKHKKPSKIGPPTGRFRSVSIGLIDRPAGAVSAASTSRRPDVEPGRDVLAALELVRPIVVRETGDGRYECLANIEVFDWLDDLMKQPRRAPLSSMIRVFVLTSDRESHELILKVDQHVVPFIFGRLTYTERREKKKQVRDAKLKGLSTKPGRRTGRPLVKQD